MLKSKEYTTPTKNELLDSAYSILAIKPSIQLAGNYIYLKLADNPIDISGYEQLIEISSYSNTDGNLGEKNTYSIQNLDKSVVLTIGKQDSVTIGLAPFYQTLREEINKNVQEYFNPTTNSYHLPDSVLNIKTESKHYYISLLFKTMNFTKRDEGDSNSFDGLILLKKKE